VHVKCLNIVTGNKASCVVATPVIIAHVITSNSTLNIDYIIFFLHISTHDVIIRSFAKEQFGFSYKYLTSLSISMFFSVTSNV